MKKIFLLCLWVAFILSACQKDNEPAPGERPDERLNEVLSQYKSQLVGAEHGWKAILYPEGGAGYSFWLKFSESDRVTMSSDINTSTAAVLESSYRLKALQRPALLFDTYSYLHILSDPDATKSGGDWGEGKYSDFEFSFTSVSPDTVTLTGNLKGSKMILVKANQEEAENYINRILEKASIFENINNFTTYFKRLTVGNQAFDVSVRPGIRYITFTYFEGEVSKAFTTSYLYTGEGVVLIEPFNSGNITISSIKVLGYDAANFRINLNINDAAASIQEATSPAKVDVAGARRFFNTPADDYWISVSGFTVNGEQDAYKVSSIQGLSFLVFWPKFDKSNNTDYDLLGFVKDNTIAYGPAAIPNLTTDGRIVYTHLGDLGTVPPEDESAVTATRQQWTIPEGYYIIYTGATSCDLVSAKDAKAWISLFR
jgi:hypothetical protein